MKPCDGHGAEAGLELVCLVAEPIFLKSSQSCLYVFFYHPEHGALQAGALAAAMGGRGWEMGNSSWGGIWG